MALLGLVMWAPAFAEDPPNVLWIVADDLGPQLGCYGTHGVQTPNLDRLAIEGVRFSNAFSTAPVWGAVCL